MNSRPMVLVFLLLILIITSQFEWKQRLVGELDVGLDVSPKEQNLAEKEHVVKEKIILIQENEIQQLNENLRSLRLQLEQCQKAGFLNETLSVIPDGNEKQDIPAD
ncbi:hypothetical protein ZOSMA_146G00120 [Zostera marina]|uniref:Uncharacterized protein n=1 Tax=Zostera marina TaxID=29655 RepID=A0A0K9PZ67_ZOSMR|nr:hypothetical protein ZOSMA_146G00120 [Zostera marina]